MTIQQYSAEATSLVQKAGNLYPDLEVNGLFYGSHTPDSFSSHLSSVGEVATALAYIDLCDITKTPSISSYTLKHCAERWGKSNNFEPYLGNGAFILAALHRDVPMRRFSRGGPNCLIAISKRSIRKLGEL